MWPPALLDIGTSNAVEKALQRLTRRGDIRQPYCGLYDKPNVSKLTGKMVFPPRASFIDAIAWCDKLRRRRTPYPLRDGCCPSGNTGAEYREGPLRLLGARLPVQRAYSTIRCSGRSAPPVVAKLLTALLMLTLPVHVMFGLARWLTGDTS